MSLQVGDKAPDFKLYSSDLAEVSLSAFKGKKGYYSFFSDGFYRYLHRAIVYNER